jgi:small subunit ribosomal protein S6e
VADLKVVVSDPESAPSRAIKVKVKVSDSVPSTTGYKEGRALPLCRINDSTRRKLNADRFITISRIKEGEKKEKVKITFRVEVDNSVPEDIILVNKEASERFGSEEFEGEAFRAKSFQLTLDSSTAQRLIGTTIGQEIEGNLLGLPGLKLKVTGGSDDSGFPMRADVTGAVKKRILVSGPPGFHPRKRGERRRRTLRGNVISPEVVQVNTIIIR